MDREELNTLIQRLNPWYYPVQIGGIPVTPGVGARQTSLELTEATTYRTKLLVDAVLPHYSFTGKRVLDVASNCAYFSARYVEHGASSLVAIEGRAEYVKQGQLYWSANQFLPDDKYRFVQGDVTAKTTWRTIQKHTPVDFALCCGILYHIADHERLLRRIHAVTREAVLIDTRVAPVGSRKAAGFKEEGGWNWDALPDNDRVALPTMLSLLEFFRIRKYRVIPLSAGVPVTENMVRNDNYDRGSRIAMLCLKNAS